MRRGIARKFFEQTINALCAAFACFALIPNFVTSGSAQTDSRHEQIIKELRKDVSRLESMLRNNTHIGNNTPSQTSEDGTDPWAEIQNLQFYMWRSFAFDPNGLRPLSHVDTPTISAAEITEDLENRFLLVKGSQWPDAIGVAPAFNEYIALCQEIIEFRKKRLYADAKAIAKRGDLDEAFRHLIDAIEQNTGTRETGNLTTEASSEESNQKRGSESREVLKTLRSNIDALESVENQRDPEVKKSDGNTSISKHQSPEMNTNWDDFHRFMDSTINQVNASILTLKQWNGSPNSSQTLIVLIACLSTIMLLIFLVGLTRKPASSLSNTELTGTTEKSLPERVTEPEATPQRENRLVLSTGQAHLTPANPKSLDFAARSRIAAVVETLEDEAVLADLVSLVEGHCTEATATDAHLQWLASELDILRSACTRANDNSDLRVLSSHLKQMTLQIEPNSLDAALDKDLCAKVREAMITSVKRALLGAKPKDAAAAPSQAAA